MILALLFLAAPALASDVVSPVPRPESWAEVPPAPVRAPLADSGRVELGISAWNPHSTDAPSRVGGTSAFESSGLPEIRAAYVTPSLLEGSFGRLSVKGGVGLARLSRSAASSSLPGASMSGTQEYYLVPVLAAAEWRPLPADRARVFEPRISASLLPTFGIATRSALDDGGVHFGLPVELEAVLAIAPGGPFLASGLGDSSRPVLQFGTSFRVGKVDWVNVFGAGVNAGLSFGL